MRLDILNRQHYGALYEIHKRAEKFHAEFEDFIEIMESRQGFVVVAPNGELAGCISFSDYTPEADIIIFCFIDPKYRKRWASKGIYKTVFDYPFETLNVQRVTGYTVKTINDDAARFLLALGFKYEGTIRNLAKMPDGKFYDVELYGMLKSERRW
jgi:RimJ/RimL family protein N-acetyltransferase